MPTMPRAGLQLLFPFLLLLAFSSPNFSSAISSKLLPSPPNSKSICWARCHRLLQRNMDRLEQSLTVEEVLYRIGAFRKAQLLAHGTTEDHISSTSSSSSSEELALPSEQFKDICWKFFDFEDCQKQCQKVFSKGRRKKRRGGRPRPKDFAVTQPEHRLVLHFCRRTDFAIPQQFACVHKFHSFLEVHCSTYQHRAVQLRLIALQLEQTDIDARKFGGAEELGRLRKAIDQELCLLLHQHQACLVNAGLRFCPPQSSAPSHKPTAADVSPFSTSILSRSSLREHFLSLLLPFGRAVDQKAAVKLGQPPLTDSPVELDQLFSDLLLDHCQLFDFHRMAQEWMARDIGNGETEAEERKRQREFELLARLEEADDQRSTTKRAVLTSSRTTAAAAAAAADDQQTEVTLAPSSRRVFSSEEDLLDTPPNFFYSTARLPKDFYTRYAIWWGSKSAKSQNDGEQRKSAAEEDSEEEEVLTEVKLLPTTASVPRAHPRQQLLFTPISGDQPKSTLAPTWEEVREVTETRPDSSLSTPAAPSTVTEQAEEFGWSSGTTAPYLVNGRVTFPVPRWPGEIGHTEIRLMDGTTRRIWTTEEGEREWKRREQLERRRQDEVKQPAAAGGGESGVRERQQRMDEYEEEWAYEDEFASSQFEEEAEDVSSKRREEAREKKKKQRVEEDNWSEEEKSGPSILRPVVSSSVEELVNEFSSHPSQSEQQGHDHDQQLTRIRPAHAKGSKSASDQQPSYATSEPMFHETNIYFAKILEFGQEPEEADVEWLHSDRETTSPKTVAHMIHFPGDQLPIQHKNDMLIKSAELEDHRPEQQQSLPNKQSPYEILPADPSQFLLTTPIEHQVKWKIATEPADGPGRQRVPTPTERPKILVSSEPVPARKSETLLVLLGVYLTFFALAAFFLFCLVLACLERNRRQQSRRPSAKPSNTGSAILYIDPKKGTLKHVV